MCSPPACASWASPRHTHTRDCVNRWWERGQKGHSFQTEYVISNRCGGKEMVMSKARRAAGRVCALPAALSWGGSPLLLPSSTQQQGKGPRSLPSLSPLTPQLLHGLPPGRWQGRGPCPVIPSLHHLVSSSTSESPAQRCLACQHPKSCSHHLPSWAEAGQEDRTSIAEVFPAPVTRNAPEQKTNWANLGSGGIMWPIPCYNTMIDSHLLLWLSWHLG